MFKYWSGGFRPATLWNSLTDQHQRREKNPHEIKTSLQKKVCLKKQTQLCESDDFSGVSAVTGSICFEVFDRGFDPSPWKMHSFEYVETESPFERWSVNRQQTCEWILSRNSPSIRIYTPCNQFVEGPRNLVDIERKTRTTDLKGLQHRWTLWAWSIELSVLLWLERRLTLLSKFYVGFCSYLLTGSADRC